MNQPPSSDRCTSVWDAIADTTEEAASLRLRSDLMDKITALIDSKGWTQAEAASRCGVAPQRMNDLLRGRLSVFSLDALVSMATALESHQDILMEQFISADVAWGLHGND